MSNAYPERERCDQLELAAFDTLNAYARMARAASQPARTVMIGDLTRISRRAQRIIDRINQGGTP